MLKNNKMLIQINSVKNKYPKNDHPHISLYDGQFSQAINSPLFTPSISCWDLGRYVLMEAREGGPSPKTDLKEVSFVFVTSLVAAHLSVYDGH